MATYTASGAGTAAVNQEYLENGSQDTKAQFQGVTDNTYWLAWGAAFGAWVISTEPGLATTLHSSAPHAYYIESTKSQPPLSGWLVGGDGAVGPAPTLSLTPSPRNLLLTGVGR